MLPFFPSVELWISATLLTDTPETQFFTCNIPWLPEASAMNITLTKITRRFQSQVWPHYVLPESLRTSTALHKMKGWPRNCQRVWLSLVWGMVEMDENRFVSLSCFKSPLGQLTYFDINNIVTQLITSNHTMLSEFAFGREAQLFPLCRGSCLRQEIS